MIKYCIYPPKMSERFEIYYKELMVLIIEDEKVIGARQYDYSGNSKIMPYLDLPYEGSGNFRNQHHNAIDFINTEISTREPERVFWTFDTEREAFLAKVKILNNIRELFEKTQEKQKIYFNKKIPKEIDQIFEKLKKESPEYFI